jgi:hypothetical protein
MYSLLNPMQVACAVAPSTAGKRHASPPPALQPDSPPPRDVSPPPTAQPDSPLPLDTHTPGEEGTFEIPAHHLLDPNAWMDLVEDGRLQRCPVCEVNASIDSVPKQKIVFFKGVTGFCRHIRNSHHQTAEMLRQGKKGDFANYIREHSVALTPSQRVAYANKEVGAFGTSGMFTSSPTLRP